MRIYLDNCCYGRPYDDQSSEKIKLESESIINIQELIKSKKIKLATSFMLHYENLKKKDIAKRKRIDKFLREYRETYIGIEYFDKLQESTKSIIETGIKEKDAYHVASAIIANCKYFLTVDERLLKYKSDEIILMNPIDFVKMLEAVKNE